jgi:hypothetical protein
MWQKGTTVVYGPDLGAVSKEIDFNIFNGDRTLFNRYFLTDYVPVPPEDHEGGNVMEYSVVWSQGAAKRTAPHTGTGSVSTYTGMVVPYLTRVEVAQENIPDQNDPTNVNKVWVKLTDGYYVAAKYPDSAGTPRERLVRVTTTPPTDPGNPVITHKIEIFSDGTISIDDGTAF